MPGRLADCQTADHDSFRPDAVLKVKAPYQDLTAQPDGTHERRQASPNAI
jgi:hypothetical protein